MSSNPELTKPLLQGGADLGDGPRPPAYPQFGATNHALVLHQPGASLRIADTDGRFAFKKGESMTIEAWCSATPSAAGRIATSSARAAPAARGNRRTIKTGDCDCARPTAARGSAWSSATSATRSPAEKSSGIAGLPRPASCPAKPGIMWR
ncbi:MAG: hypothetical protein WDN28_19430 [Chthoniobacter sp.]